MVGSVMRWFVIVGALAMAGLLVAALAGREGATDGRTATGDRAPSATPAPSAFLSPTGDDAAACTAAAPCASLDRAWRAVEPGDVVELAAGRYGRQVLGPDAARTADAPVIFRPAAGANVRIAELRCGEWNGDRGADHVELRDVTVGGVSVQRCDGVTLRRVTVDGGLLISGSTNFTMIGGSVGPGVNTHPDVVAVYQSEPPIVPRNIVFDGVLFHDWIVTEDGVHGECLQVSDVRGFVMRNSRFTNCDTFGLHIDGTVGGPVRDVLIEGNIFERTGDHTGKNPAYFGLSIRDGRGVQVRNNVSLQAIALPSPDEDIRNWTISGNAAALEQWHCDGRIVFRDNLWSSGRCGPTDRQGPVQQRYDRMLSAWG
jgi:hypothetical protein